MGLTCRLRMFEAWRHECSEMLPSSFAHLLERQGDAEARPDLLAGRVVGADQFGDVLGEQHRLLAELRSKVCEDCFRVHFGPFSKGAWIWLLSQSAQAESIIGRYGNLGRLAISNKKASLCRLALLLGYNLVGFHLRGRSCPGVWFPEVGGITWLRSVLNQSGSVGSLCS